VIDVPHAVLSEHFSEHMQGRRVLHAVFTTFQLEPAFFEEEVLPVFFDLNFHHVSKIRVAQLEDALRTSGAKIAIYYDPNGLITSGEGSAKLDIARIPVRRRGGLFHPKDVLVLVEELEPTDDGTHPQHLVVATMSANMTKAGWWQNVEACHVEVLTERAETRLRDGLAAHIKAIRDMSPDDVDHSALDEIHAFVKRMTMPAHRSQDGALRPHFHGGTHSFIDFVADTARDDLRGLNLEIISPFFDGTDESAPLAELLRRFKPAETRILLPRDAAGAAQIPEALHAWVAAQENVSWARLPGELTMTARTDAAKARRVHAKVYRFFSPHPKREYLIVGSVNLTRPAHQRGGNVESAMLVYERPRRRPDFWLEIDAKKPREFVEPDRADGDEAASTAGSRLALRYDWRTGGAGAYWDDDAGSPDLLIASAGVVRFAVQPLPARQWTPLADDSAKELESCLGSSSFVEVRGDRALPVTILVMEDRMWKKPSLLSQFSMQDILKYWSFFTDERRLEFVALHGAQKLRDASEHQLVTPTVRNVDVDSVFQRFAGFFHAFECLKAAVVDALERRNEKPACHRLFGKKHDSLGSLLERVRSEVDRDPVDRYVIALCATQLCDELRREYREFWSSYPAEVAELQAALDVRRELRDALMTNQPDTMPAFLEWFDRRFLARARTAEAEP